MTTFIDQTPETVSRVKTQTIYQNNFLVGVFPIDFFVILGIDIHSKLGERKNEKISCIINCCIGTFRM